MIDSHGPLARIMERVPPPAEVVHGSGDWGAAERALGTPLPEDFKRVVEAYGRGDFWGGCACARPSVTTTPSGCRRTSSRTSVHCGRTSPSAIRTLFSRNPAGYLPGR
ncbi:hypothetical protein Sliba_12650 [Streptomyces nigrescens]|uniref:Knr4/Smi1-like domain-containing protein n=1 Tax=Streptomyces nigrescens TaxID=1920 RepID=A0A640TCS0_STRNI|nr:hypothetical protein Sliba_12650 [Streptomyces libani subsp. libani]GGV88215.1 hypothetical protein GCM10010500_10060 [Streptomyces libani subsp. libani]